MRAFWSLRHQSALPLPPHPQATSCLVTIGEVTFSGIAFTRTTRYVSCFALIPFPRHCFVTHPRCCLHPQPSSLHCGVPFHHVPHRSSPRGWTCGAFPAWAVVNRAARGISYECVRGHALSFLVSKMPRPQDGWSTRAMCVGLSPSGCARPCRHQQGVGARPLTFLPARGVVGSVNRTSFGRCAVTSQLALVCVSLMSSDAVDLFTCFSVYLWSSIFSDRLPTFEDVGLFY